MRSHDEPDAVLVARTLTGDHDAFSALVVRSRARVRRVVASVLDRASEIQDVMQEAYASAYVNLASFRGSASFATWVSRIAVREALAARASDRRVVLTADGAAAELSSSRDPERAVLARECGGAIVDALGAVPEHYRIVFLLREIDELSVAETAASLRLTEAAVKVRLHRARALLADEIAARFGVTRSEVVA